MIGYFDDDQDALGWFDPDLVDPQSWFTDEISGATLAPAATAGFFSILGVLGDGVPSTTVTISCSVGAATAAGLSASINESLACSVGAATATGLAAALNETVACGIGQATGAGLAATLVSDGTIGCSVGTATASGLPASLNETLAAGIGAATATGLLASILADEVLACGIGVATAQGLPASIILTETSNPIVLSGGITGSELNRREKKRRKRDDELLELLRETLADDPVSATDETPVSREIPPEIEREFFALPDLEFIRKAMARDRAQALVLTGLAYRAARDKALAVRQFNDDQDAVLAVLLTM